ncbi:6-phosphogluconolactonase [Neptunitalea chrysea]|uniref:6-phosphogluconolactonase n=1 Tax=Neptunitalea chrysea TaxID=1647581 RepID=A0A9W6B7T2_9FLAO|nr:6-phosphogluconolactonase [Neptunitalea chrysea]GLB52829.1 6-phosphogluconolactonase [Neptunitalea chrysea]
MLNIFDELPKLHTAVADYFVEKANETIEKTGKFTVALTGGSSPAGMYEIVTTVYKDKVDWSKVYVFWGDERWVPLNDDRSNAGNAYKNFLDKLPIPADQIYPMWKVGVTPEAYADEYAAILEEVLTDGETFDLIFLGMGDDGHTASLFPGEAVIDETEKKVAAYFLAPQDMYRITLTAPVLNKASNVAFITYGSKKAPALFEVLKGEPNVKKYPSQIVKPDAGSAVWFVDVAAAAKL